MNSGCTLRTASSPTRESTTSKPKQSSKKPNEQFDSTYFDQFLKATSQTPPSSTGQTSSDSSTTEFDFVANFTNVGLEDFLPIDKSGEKYVKRAWNEKHQENSDFG